MIAIIGAGAAGLTAGRILQAAGKHVEIFEAQPRVGGRVGSRTIVPDASDIVGTGWTLDLGFQVLLSAYPAVQRQLNLTALDFQPLSAGALLCRGDQRYPVSDPLRQPQELWSTATNPQLSVLT